MSKSADAFRTISEVAEWLGVQTHVLRFWESKFSQVKPVKRAGGRRYYRPADMLLLGGIRKLLHDDGLTIKGVQKILREEGVSYVADMSPALDDDTTAHLDADLAVQTGADVEQATDKATSLAGDLDHAPEHSRSAESPVEPATEATTDGSPALPSFLRSSEPEADAEIMATPRAPDVPTLTPELDNLEAASDDANVAADAPSVAEPEALPTEPEPVVEDIPQSATEAPTEAQQTEVAPTEDHLQELASDTNAAAPLEPATDQPLTEPTPDAPAEADALPTFMRAPAAMDAAEQVDEVAASQPAETGPEPEPVAPPRPRIVDVPDDEGIDFADVSASALTKAATIQHLTAAQRAQLRPLVAQLTALRDKMVHDRQDPR